MHPERQRYLDNLYTDFVKPVMDQFDEGDFFHPREIDDAIRQPYTAGEIGEALERREEVYLANEKLGIWHYDPDQSV